MYQVERIRYILSSVPNWLVSSVQLVTDISFHSWRTQRDVLHTRITTKTSTAAAPAQRYRAYVFRYTLGRVCRYPGCVWCEYSTYRGLGYLCKSLYRSVGYRHRKHTKLAVVLGACIEAVPNLYPCPPLLYSSVYQLPRRIWVGGSN